MRHRIEIKPHEDTPVGCHFLVGEADLADVVSGYTIRHAAGRPPTVEVDLLGHGYAALLENAAVELDPRLAEVLVKLGWTPPTVGAPA